MGEDMQLHKMIIAKYGSIEEYKKKCKDKKEPMTLEEVQNDRR